MEKFFLNENIYVIVSGWLNNNTYIIFENNYALIIDPSYAEKEIKKFLIENKIKNYAFLITHHHYDHIGNLKKIWKPGNKIYICEQEKNYSFGRYSNIFDDLINNELIKKDIIFSNNEGPNNILGIDIFFAKTPSHTIGSYTYIYKNFFFTGDFIFATDIGFFDMENNGNMLFKKSIKKIKKYLNDDSFICSGHNKIDKWSNVKIKNRELIEYSGDENE